MNEPEYHPDFLRHLHEAVPEAYADRDELTAGEAAALAFRGTVGFDTTVGPSPFHVWSEHGWALPAEVEIAQLDEMEDPHKDSIKEVKQRLAEQRAALDEWETQNATD